VGGHLTATHPFAILNASPQRQTEEVTMSKNYIVSTETLTICHNAGAIVYPYEVSFPSLDDYGTSVFRTLPLALAYAAAVLDADEKGDPRGPDYTCAYEGDEFVRVAEFFFRGTRTRI